MAGRLGTVQGPVFGLVLLAAGFGLGQAAQAETWAEPRAKTAQGARLDVVDTVPKIVAINPRFGGHIPQPQWE